MSPVKKLKCEAAGCTSLRRSECGIAFFAFPKCPNRRETWIQFAGNSELSNLNSDQLQRRFLCALHFEDRQFINKFRRRLLPYAVPTVPRSEDATSLGDSNPGLANLPDVDCPSVSFEGATSFVRPNTGVENVGNVHCSSNQPADSTTHPASDSEPASGVARMSRSTKQMGARTRHKVKATRVSLKALARAVGIANEKLKDPDVHAAMRTAQDWRICAGKVQARLEQAQRLNASLRQVSKCSFIDMVEDMLISPAAMLIVEGQLANFPKEPNGRRWTDKQKGFALAIYKRSRKAYRWLYTYLCLPSEKTLLNMLKEIPLEPGICQPILDHMEKTSKKVNKKSKYCTLMFDEVKLRDGLYFNLNKGIVEGFEDFGQRGRTTRCADHSLVFMLRGIDKKWKMPVAYFYTKDTAPGVTLSQLICDVISAVQASGYTVVCTVSDQAPTNRSAISSLRSKCLAGEYEPVYEVNGQKIYHIFDIPHILKNIRNNLISSDLCIQEGVIAKWQHLIDYYEFDCNMLGGKSGLRLEHVYPHHRNKMRVKFAVQAVSETVCNRVESVILSSEGKNLGHCAPTVVAFALIDMFFDLTNGSGPRDKSKPLRCSVSSSSPHHEMWPKMISTLQKWSYVHVTGSKKGRTHRPPCLQGWAENVRAFQGLWQKLSGVGFSSMDLRQFNQDPLENFFGTIRQSNGSNHKPTCQQFESALKTVIVNNLSASQIDQKNCANDQDELLSDLGDLFRSCRSKSISAVPASSASSTPCVVRGIDSIYLELEKYVTDKRFGKFCRQQPTIVCNDILEVVLKMPMFQPCRLCKSCMCSSERSSDHILFERQSVPLIDRYGKYLDGNVNAVDLPSASVPVNDDVSYVAPQVINMFINLRREVLQNAVKYLYSKNVLKLLSEFCETFDYDWLCPIHKDDLRKGLIDLMSKSILTNVCQCINKRLREKEKQKALAKSKKKGSSQGNGWASKHFRLRQTDELDNWDGVENDCDEEWEDVFEDEQAQTVAVSSWQSIQDLASRLGNVTGVPHVSALSTTLAGVAVLCCAVAVLAIIPCWCHRDPAASSETTSCSTGDHHQD